MEIVLVATKDTTSVSLVVTTLSISWCCCYIWIIAMLPPAHAIAACILGFPELSPMSQSRQVHWSSAIINIINNNALAGTSTMSTLFLSSALYSHILMRNIRRGFISPGHCMGTSVKTSHKWRTRSQCKSERTGVMWQNQCFCATTCMMFFLHDDVSAMY